MSSARFRSWPQILAALLVFLPAVTARAGEAHYLLMFASQRVPNDPDYSHTFATFVRATWVGDCPVSPTLEWHTISWLPANGIVRAAATEPEPGRNYGLDETLRLARSNDERISLWGPYPIQAELYCRARKRIAELETGRIRYKANDAGFNSDQVSNCIHALSAVVDGNRVRVGSPGWGEIASYIVLLRMRPWVLDETPDQRIGAALGLGAYPLIYRDRFTGPRTGPLGVLHSRLFGPERGLVATYGSPTLPLATKP